MIHDLEPPRSSFDSTGLSPPFPLPCWLILWAGLLACSGSTGQAPVRPRGSEPGPSSPPPAGKAELHAREPDRLDVAPPEQPCRVAMASSGAQPPALIATSAELQSKPLRAAHADLAGVLKRANAMVAGVKAVAEQPPPRSPRSRLFASLEFATALYQLGPAPCDVGAVEAVKLSGIGSDRATVTRRDPRGSTASPSDFRTETRIGPGHEADGEAATMVAGSVSSLAGGLERYEVQFEDDETFVKGVMLVDAATREALWLFARTRYVRY